MQSGCHRLLSEAPWGLPLLYLLASRGGCLGRGALARLLDVRVPVVRRLLWGLSRRGLVLMEGDSACINPRVRSSLLSCVGAVARKRNHYVVMVGGSVVLVSHRASGARAWQLSVRDLCKVLLAASEHGASVSLVAQATGLPTRTVSYALKALSILGCPGPSCLAAGTCGVEVRDKPGSRPRVDMVEPPADPPKRRG